MAVGVGSADNDGRAVGVGVGRGVISGTTDARGVPIVQPATRHIAATRLARRSGIAGP